MLAPYSAPPRPRTRFGEGLEVDMIDHNELANQIRTMSVRSQLYKTLKRELSARGYWKNRARGKHDKGQMNQKAPETNR